MWLQQLIQWITTDRSWVSAAIVGEHWVPVVLTKRGSVITLTTTPEGSTLIDAAQQVTVCEGLTLQAHQRMLPTSFHGDFFFGRRPLPFGGSHCRHVSTRIEAYLRTSGGSIHRRRSVCAGQDQRYTNWTTASPHTSFHGDCGFQAFVWILATLGKFDFLIAIHMHLKTIRDLAIGGTKVDSIVHQQLSELLAQYGVWEDRVAERASKVIDGIPAHILRNVLPSKRPWVELKHAASHAQPLIKLIHPDELTAQITSRANQRRTYWQIFFLQRLLASARSFQATLNPR